MLQLFVKKDKIMSVLELEQEILNLDLESQMYLADSLNQRIQEASEMDFEDEWIEECERRMKDVEDGKVKLINSDDFIKNMWEKH